jgi:hypothetical protein
VIYRTAEAVRQELLPERVSILSLGSQQGNRHVHWHIAPLPTGVPYEQQQLEALQMSSGILQLSREEQNNLAQRLRRRMLLAGLNIRPARRADCAQLAQVQVDSYQGAYRGLFPDDYLAQLSYAEQKQDWRLWLSTHPEETFLVAELIGGQIGGYVRGRPGSVLDGYNCELAALHVRQ